ncbi:MAG: L,D-transpeptidase family protein [Phycisphaeraceae bacterium]|nr:L,D-transpeptidase family protein [Phycisphaeraceae bacterium]
MALASQSIRNSAPRRAGFAADTGSRRSPWIWIALFAGCVGLAGIIWWLIEDRVTAPAGAQAANSPAQPVAAAVPTQRLDVVRHPPAPSPSPAQTPARIPTQAGAAVSAPAGSNGIAPPATTSAPSTATTTSATSSLRNPATAAGAGMKLIEDGKLIEGRAALSDVLLSPSTNADDAEVIRETLASVNARLVFSKDVVTNDPFAKLYTVEAGDRLIRIANEYKVPYRFIEQINGIEAPKLRAGQRIKIIQGPFHAVIHKRDFRMDLFLTGADGKKVYVRSFAVGLGEQNSTPEGAFVIKPGGKVQGGGWTNPRTGESFAPGDPKNPIGKYWLALQGADTRTQAVRGYGIHGTIQPESIGQQMSMGCIRLNDPDIEQVYSMLFEGKSSVEIMP